MSRFSSDYLKTRLKFFSSRLIKIDQLSHLIGQDIDQILIKVSELTGHSYQLENSIHSRIENQLVSAALRDFQILIRPFSGRERQFFYYTIRWFELVNLKLLIRGKFTKTSNATIRQQLVELGDFAAIPIDKLIETEDPHEMLRLLETTAYARIVRQARYVYEEHGNDIFLLDATIDRTYLINLKQRLKTLQDQDEKQVAQVMGVLLDRFNLLWLLRYRFSYGLSPAKSYYLLTAIGNKLHSADLMRLAKMQNLQQILSSLPEPLKSQLSGLNHISEIENVLEFSTLTVAARALNQQGNLISGCFSYILMREAETRFLQALVKGKRLQFDTDLIQLAVMGKS